MYVYVIPFKHVYCARTKHIMFVAVSCTLCIWW